MADYNPPTQDLPIFDKLVFTNPDEYITISTADKRYLKFPNAQGTENLQTTNINGVLTVNSTSNFKNQVTLNGTLGTDRQITASYYNLTDANGVSGNGGRLFQLGTSVILNAFGNNAPILLRPSDGSGTLQTVIDLDTTSVDTKRPLLMNDTNDTNNRAITSSFYNFYNSGVAGTLTQNGTLYNNAGNMYLQNTTNGGTINFYLNDAGGVLQTPLQLLTTGNLCNNKLTISANNNLQMNAGTGKINQSITTSDTSTRNTFKLSEFVFNSNTATGGPTAFEFYDSVNNKGLFIMPNAGTGSLGDTSMANDCVLSSRSTQNNNAITISNWNTNMKNGLRVFTIDSDNCGLTLQCGQNSGNAYTEFRMAYTRGSNTTTTTFNNVINFNPATGTGLPNAIPSTRRKLEGLGTLSFTDNLNGGSGGITTSSIYTDSTLVSGNNGMYYNTNINGGSHIFSSNDINGTNSLSLLLNTDINNTYNRMYQELNSSWSNVNGYYELAKDAYPALTSYTSGNKAVSIWTARNIAQVNNWCSIVWANKLGLFCAVSYTLSTSNVVTSPDGINWTARTTPNTNSLDSICWSPELNLLVAVGSVGIGNRVSTSSDGITWTSRSSANDYEWNSVCWSAELTLFVAVSSTGVGERVMTSPDGISWTERNTPADNSWESVIWIAELGLFVAVASAGGTAADRVMTSSNGTNWTSRAAASTNAWRSLCWSPELGLIVAVSSSGTGDRVMTSSNGINWTSRTSSADNSWLSVCWSSELQTFVAVAESGTNTRIMTSFNGINWTTRPSNNVNWASVCWSKELGIFCAVGYDGTNRAMTSSLTGRPPTSFNVFDSTSNSISETGDWTLRANVINTDLLEIRQIGAAQNKLEISFDGGTTTYIKSRPKDAAAGVSSLNLNCYNGTTDQDVMGLNPNRIQVRRPIQFSYLTNPSTNSQLGHITNPAITSATINSQTGPKSDLGNFTLPAGSWIITVILEFAGSGSHNLTTFEYGLSTTADTFTTTMPYVLTYMREPLTTIKTTKITKQITMNIQITGSVQLHFTEHLSWSGGGTVTITGFCNYMRTG